MTIDEAVDRWASRRDDLRRLHATVDGATICEEMIADLKALAEESDIKLNLRQAAMRTGYSADHLSRMIATGKLPNHGRKGAPRVRVSECPHKSKSSIAVSTASRYDVLTDARSLRARR